MSTKRMIHTITPHSYCLKSEIIPSFFYVRKIFFSERGQRDQYVTIDHAQEEEDKEGDEPICDIDEILKRAETRSEEQMEEDDDGLLSSFKVI